MSLAPSARCVVLASTLALAVSLLTGPVAEAGIALSPLQQQVAVSPGATARFAVTIEHVRRTTDPASASIRLEVVDFSVSREGVVSFGEGTAHERSAASWITLDAGELTLAPGQVRQVNGTVSAPLNADGDYWAAVLMTIGGPRAEGGVNVVLRTASAVFVRVARRGYRVRPTVTSLEVALPTFPDAAAHRPPPGGGDAAPAAAPALEVRADVANEGALAFLASGVAHVYLDGRRKVAVIPMHSRRRRILPGHVRQFDGVMPTPLPAGNYVLRLVFEADSNAASRAFREAVFSISSEQAQEWREQSQVMPGPQLKLTPGELKMALGPGRFTAAGISVANSTAGTVQVRCRAVEVSPPEGWLELDPAEFTLAPYMRRSLLCRLRVPTDAQDGEFKAVLEIESESAGLLEEREAELHRVPIHLEVRK